MMKLTLGYDGIIVVVQVGAVKIYVLPGISKFDKWKACCYGLVFFFVSFFFLNASQFSLAWYRLKTSPWTLFGESRLHYSYWPPMGPAPYSREVHGLKLYLTQGNFLSALKRGGILKIKGLVQGEEKNLKF
jgi:hypothetical protein